MRLAADVGGEYRRRLPGTERADLVGEQALREFGLKDRVGARRATAQMWVRHRRQLETEISEQRLDAALEFQPVLERAGRVKSHALSEARGVRREEGLQFR